VRVIHLPCNIASQISVTVRALRDIGVDARGVASAREGQYQDSREIKVWSRVPREQHPVRWLLESVAMTVDFLRAIRWADVIHWHFAVPGSQWIVPLKFAAFCNKPRVVEVWGDDVRVPELAAVGNPYMARYYSERPGYARRRRREARRAQGRFARYGFQSLIPYAELVPYVDKALFPSPFRTLPRLFLSELHLAYPEPSRNRPMVVHTPTNKGVKGTDAVLRSIEELKSTHDFEFRLIHGVSREQALASVRESDIMLDQFVIGSYGLASLEAMALGKPTVCYITPSVMSELPGECPIVNANQDNLRQVLRGLLEDGQRRHEIGRRSRAYVERYHDAHELAAELVVIYEELLKKHNRAR